MKTLTRSLSLAAGLSLLAAAAAFAQDDAHPPATQEQADPAAGLSTGTPVQAADGPGTTYTEAKFDDWEQRCLRTEDGANPCQLYQLLKDDKGNSVAEISLFALPAGQAAVAGATIVAPLETLLTEQLTFAVDTNQPKRYPFTWCAPLGCVSRVGFTQAEVDGFKKGNKATLTIVPVAAPDQKVVLNVSLKGFTAGFDAISKLPVKAN
ncbi:MAG: invasion associated locus B family protein [Cereibacter sphaeroides]|uniref:Invasion associated locus B family protein n=1 Tax=Cereibacter sphaeroides TaxID=1063 RepID=A0A2W5SJE1_CERSP|nr:MAG: invasion associated locus B family protein [Cereibacter sphaeroides]